MISQGLNSKSTKSGIFCPLIFRAKKLAFHHFIDCIQFELICKIEGQLAAALTDTQD